MHHTRENRDSSPVQASAGKVALRDLDEDQHEDDHEQERADGLLDEPEGMQDRAPATALWKQLGRCVVAKRGRDRREVVSRSSRTSVREDLVSPAWLLPSWVIRALCRASRVRSSSGYPPAAWPMARRGSPAWRSLAGNHAVVLLRDRADGVEDLDLLRREVLAEVRGSALVRKASRSTSSTISIVPLARQSSSVCDSKSSTHVGSCAMAASTAAVSAACCSALSDCHLASFMTTRLEFSWWLDMLMTSWTSWRLLATMLLMGFSWPSTVPCWSAR